MQSRISVLALLAALALGLAVVVARETGASTPSFEPAPHDAVEFRSVPGGLLVWVTPDRATTVGDVMYADGAVEARTVTDRGETIVTSLGPGTTAGLVAGGRSPIVWVRTYEGSTRITQYSPRTGDWTELLTVTDEIQALSAGSGHLDVVLDGQPGAVRTIELGSDGAAAASVLKSTPELAADERSVVAYSEQGDLEYLLAKSHMTTEPVQGRVTALVRSGDELFALSCTGLAAAVTDTVEGATRSLDGYSWVHAAALGGDGSLYAAVDAAGRGTPLHILRIDPRTLTIIRDSDTGWSYNEKSSTPSYIGGCDFVPTPDGVALVASAVGSDGLPTDTRIWVLESDGMRAVAAPDGAGRRAGFGADGGVLVYCLPASSAVTRVNLSTASSGVDPRLSAPSGSYVVIAAE
jgi:hypothetical protein